MIPGMHIARRAVLKAVRLVRNVAFDLRYGAFLGGTVSARNPGARATGNTDYWLMDQLFRGRIRPDDVLVDIGCGRGRVLNWWLRYHRAQRIYGLELLDEVAAQTATRLRKYANVRILSGDAIANLPTDGTFFYLFNPFDAETMTKFKARMRELCLENERRRILYFAPLHVDVFASDPEWRVTVHEVAPPPVGVFEERHRTVAEIAWKGA